MVQTLNSRSMTAGEERRARRNNARRLEILESAAQIFRKRGFSETGMREIAEAADLSPGNLYHYFDGKHEILYFCQDRSLDILLASFDEANRAKKGPADKLRMVMEAHVHCVLDEVAGSIAHLEVHGLPDELRSKLVAKRDRYEKGVCGLIAGGVDAGEFAPCDPKLVTRAILGALNSTVRWFQPGGGKSAAEIAKEFAQYLARGLTPPAGKNSNNKPTAAKKRSRAKKAAKK